MDFGYLTFMRATAVLLGGIIESMVPVVARTEGKAAVIDLNETLKGARNLDTILSRIEAGGGEFDRNSARTVAKGLATSLDQARETSPQLSRASTRALKSTCDCAHALHRTLASPLPSTRMGARVLAHGLDTASALAAVLTLGLGGPQSPDARCRSARDLTLSLARARELAASSDLPGLARELDAARELSLALATTPDAGEGSIPLWIFFSLGRALGRLDDAFARSNVQASEAAVGEDCIRITLRVPLGNEQERVQKLASGLALAIGELHVVSGGASLLAAEARGSTKGEITLRLSGSDGEELGGKVLMVEEILEAYAAKRRASQRSDTGPKPTTRSEPIDGAAVASQVAEELACAAFDNEQGQLANRLASKSFGAPVPVVSEVITRNDARTAVTAAMRMLERVGVLVTITSEPLVPA